MAKRKQPPAPAPPDVYLVNDPYAMVRGPWIGKWLVVGRTFAGVRAVGRQAHLEGVTMGVVDRVILDHHLRHYAVLDENTSLQSILEGIKGEMLAHGATPLAVQWIGELSPFEEKELTIMAEKLKTKGGKADAKPAAAAKGKGNPEALAKAREARASAAQEDRKYKHLVKRADIKTREGTWTGVMVDIIMSNKSTDDAKAELAKHKEFGDRRLDFGWAEKKEYISF